jgi:hypothetical protein
MPLTTRFFLISFPVGKLSLSFTKAPATVGGRYNGMTGQQLPV